MASVMSIDFITTIIALNFRTQLVESNPINAFFFSFGVLGWIVSIFFSFSCIYLFSLFFEYMGDLVHKRTLSKTGSRWESEIARKIALRLWVGTFCVVECLVIINNIILILLAD